jgi:hypothetical protein
MIQNALLTNTFTNLHSRPGLKSTLSRIVSSATRSAIRGWASAPGSVSFDGSPHTQHYGAPQPAPPIGGFAAHSIVTELSIATQNAHALGLPFDPDSQVEAPVEPKCGFDVPICFGNDAIVSN